MAADDTIASRIEGIDEDEKAMLRQVEIHRDQFAALIEGTVVSLDRLRATAASDKS